MDISILKAKSAFIIKVDYCDEQGRYNEDISEIYIISSIENFINIRNKFEYWQNAAVSVYYSDGDNYCHLFEKCFDCMGYESLAQINKHPLENFRLTKGEITIM